MEKDRTGGSYYVFGLFYGIAILTYIFIVLGIFITFKYILSKLYNSIIINKQTQYKEQYREI